MTIGRLSFNWVDVVAFDFINKWSTPPPPPEGWLDVPYRGWWFHFYRLVIHWHGRLRPLDGRPIELVKRHKVSPENRIIW